MPNQIARTGRILVVTAQPASAASIAALLERHGHAAMIAATREEALASAAEHVPDLILLDLPMPGQVGLELLATLHEQPALRPIPVIVLASASDHARLLRAFEAGAVDCIGKPCSPEEMMARVHVHLRLKLTRDRLEQVARERQELVTLVAHDLKNPLTSVLFACEMLALPDCKAERAPRYLQVIDDSTREALGYIRNYLQSQAHASAQPAGKACAHLGETLRWLAARYELQLEASGLHLRIEAPEPDACVAIGGQVLRQLGENLISNALKYARDGGELELIAKPGAPGFWQLVAQDRGPGVPAGFRPQLFTPFKRAHENDAAASHSSGLGLALARQIAINAGGRLWYEDRDGGGARFLLELPEIDCGERCA
jgi:two-component system sensor histidine kinase/response regulator